MLLFTLEKAASLLKEIICHCFSVDGEECNHCQIFVPLSIHESLNLVDQVF